MYIVKHDQNTNYTYINLLNYVSKNDQWPMANG